MRNGSVIGVIFVHIVKVLLEKGQKGKWGGGRSEIMHDVKVGRRVDRIRDLFACSAKRRSDKAESWHSLKPDKVSSRFKRGLAHLSY